MSKQANETSDEHLNETDDGFVEAHRNSLEDVASAALEFAFIDGSADYTARDRAQALCLVHVTAGIHRRRTEDRAGFVRRWLARSLANGTPEEYDWFGYGTDKELLEAVDAEMSGPLTAMTQEAALEIMLYA